MNKNDLIKNIANNNNNNNNSDIINKPEHYHKGGIDVISFIKDKISGEALEGFYQVNVIKYITRYKDKNGIEDLKKAEFYLKKLIEMKTSNNTKE